MIYTVGNEAIYEAAFRRDTPRKLGRTADYAGGSVWRTYAEAAAHAPVGYAVYGVLAEWEGHTVPSAGGDWHDLTVTSTIVRVVPGEEPL